MRIRRLALGLIVMVALTGCWEQRGFDAGHSNASPLPTSVNAANVGGLTPRFSATAGPAAGASWSAISSGSLYVIGASLRAYDASGATGCTGPAPATCTPKWTSNESTGFLAGPVVGGGRVWGVVGGHLVGYDAAGVTGCSGVPRRCAPVVNVVLPVNLVDNVMWTADGIYLSGTNQTMSMPVFTESLLAYDARGALRWRAALGTSSFAYPSGPAADHDLVYARLRGGGVAAFDAHGVTGCSGSPVVCTPRWTYATPDSHGGLAVHDGRLIIGSDSVINVYDAKGVSHCSGAPKVCTPRWSTSGGGFSVAVTANRLYALESTSTSVYSLGGAGCSGSPVVCTPLWSDAPTGSPYAVLTISVAGDVVYTTSLTCEVGCSGIPEASVDAHSAAGTVGCSGTPKVCQPLWSAVVPSTTGSVMVVGDTVYVAGFLAPVPTGPDPAVIAFRI